MTAVAAVTADAQVATIFNSAVAAYAISAAWEVGAFDELKVAEQLDAADFAERHDLDPLSTLGMFRALASVGIVSRVDDLVTISSNFDSAYRNKSFFHWLSRGSAELFRQMPLVLSNKNRTGQFFRRDAAAIAYACKEINELCYAPEFWAAMDRLDFELTVVADLGCGSGARLMDVLRRYPGTRGVGVDIADPSLEVARVEAAEAGLDGRTNFVQGDVLQLEAHPEFDQVELVTCFMMGHDFWPRQRCIATLRRLRETFPNAQRLLLGDATRTAYNPDSSVPVFTLGFELAHDLMGTTIPTLADWESVFDECDWKLLRTNRIEMAVGEVIFELG